VSRILTDETRPPRTTIHFVTIAFFTVFMCCRILNRGCEIATNFEVVMSSKKRGKTRDIIITAILIEEILCIATNYIP
jgi:hypothetical protein